MERLGITFQILGITRRPPKLRFVEQVGPFDEQRMDSGFAEGVYIPAGLVKERLTAGDAIKLIAVRSFDKKRDRWTWKACAIFEHVRVSELNGVLPKHILDDVGRCRH
jgi:hypothetical protein